MALILDAYNVLHCTHVLPERYALMSLAELCLVLHRSGYHRDTITLVCDGSPKPDEPPPQPYERMRVIHSGAGRDADTLIAHLLADAQNPKQITVISNDRQVQRSARSRGARVMGSETFLRKLVEADRAARAALPEPEKPAQMGSAAEWMQKFQTSEGPPPPTSQELESQTDRWMREFGFEPDEDD